MASKERCHARCDGDTGSYWIPIFNLLEGHFTVVLANPDEVKNRKGHKTDRKDAEHLADLLRHNHVRSSYIPPEPVCQLRDLTRRRIQLTQDASRERNRVQKLLEQANVKIASVLSDVFGVSGQNMLLALLAGQTTAEEIAQLARVSRQLLAGALDALHCIALHCTDFGHVGRVGGVSASSAQGSSPFCKASPHR
jgi:transposase